MIKNLPKSLIATVSGIIKEEPQKTETVQKEITLNESTRGMPLKGHPYHKKSDAELQYIQKDAGLAAQAMKGHAPAAEAKYLDQVNDASTVLHYRSKGGARVTDSNEEVQHSDEFVQEAKKMKGKDPCWDNHEMVGTKKKNGREVPNCVPKQENTLLTKYNEKKELSAKQKKIAKLAGDPEKIDAADLAKLRGE